MANQYASQQGASEARRPSPGPPLSPSRSHPSSWSQFSIPTTADSLSSGFKYDTRLRQLGVSNEEWRQFTNEVVNEAKLSLEDDKVAWGAGIATGTAGSALLLLLGPVAGYYTGKAVHKRTVVEKVKERLLEDGQMSKVLRKWNGGAWAQKGFHTWIELPDQASSVRSDVDAKRFRILVLPGVANPAKSSTSRPSSSSSSTEPSSLQGTAPQQTPQKRPVPPPPAQSHVPPPIQQSQNVPAQIPVQQKSDYPPPPPPPIKQTQNLPPQPPTNGPSFSTKPSSHQTPEPQKRPVPLPPIQSPIAQMSIPTQQTQNLPVEIPVQQKSDYPPPPPLPIQSHVSHMNLSAQQTQDRPTHTPIPQKLDYPPPTAPSFHQPPPVPLKNSTVEPHSYQQPSIPHRDSDVPPPLFYHSGGHSKYPNQMQKPAAEEFNYPPPPPLPAKFPPLDNKPSNNQIYEMPNNEPSTVFELPDNQAGVAELPAEPVHYYEMDGGSVPQHRR